MRKEKHQPHKCPVCGEHEFSSAGSDEICPVCGWEDDFVQEDDPDSDVGANDMSLNEYKAAYESGWRPEWLTED